ncbi:MAG: DUF1592 domain-containing protein [Fuerstiella sp.]|nr:DUF1592 domain-containing protein [Fuerstiella sp.]
MSLRILLWATVFSLTTETSRAADDHLSEAAELFLKSQCLDCHSGDDAEAALDLQHLSRDLNTQDNFDRWVRVFDRVDAGEMPPKDSDPAPVQTSTEFLRNTGQWLKSHQRQQNQSLGRVRARRLTNLQLERTLHDLLGIDVPLAVHMPDEPRTNGFTTVAAGQSMSHFQLQTHLSVVDAALNEAFRRGMSEPDETETFLTPQQIVRTNPTRRCREPEMLNGKAVVWRARTTFYGRIPATTAREDGWYRIKIKASALNTPKNGGVWCTVRTGPCVSSAPLLGWSGAFEATDEPQDWTFEAWLPKGHMFEIRPGDSTLKEGKFRGGQIGTGEGTPQNVPGLAIHALTLERIHKGASNTAIRRHLLGELKFKWNRRTKSQVLISQTPLNDIAGVMRRFARRAFRRPVSDEVVAPYIDLVQQDLDNNVPFSDALRGGYRAILCSPRFLHFHETPGQLDNHALASRLSYFLWNSMPDEKLMTLADAGQMHEPEVLRQQLNRMLKDGRGQNFVKDFAAEWLDLSEIDFTEPDRKLYSGFDVIVQQSMLDETHAFLARMIKDNSSITNLIDADFTFLNSRLARYYNIDRVDGDQLRRVSLRPQDKRGGLLTHGSIMKVTANGTTTSPVIRGVWISERLLGIEIPPPPEGVPAIEPDIRGAKTIREMLAKHKADVSCESCHVKIDPPGFALENFDPSGRWRERYISVVKGRRSRGLKVNPEFDLPDGRHFTSLKQFQNLIVADDDALAENVARQLLTYGTGAPCGFADRHIIDTIVKHTEWNQHGLRSLIQAIVTSSVFRKK